MSETDEISRMIDKEPEPSEEDLLYHMCMEAQIAWKEIRFFVEDHYNFEPNIVYWGKKIGWGIKYQRSGRTLVSFYPEKDCFATLLTLGKKEVEVFESIRKEINPAFVNVFDNTKQLHDGRWIWLRVYTIKDTSDIKRLITIKKKPK